MVEQRFSYRNLTHRRRGTSTPRARIRNSTTPSPPSLRSFLLSGVPWRDAAAGRHRHDHQYDGDHHFDEFHASAWAGFSLPTLSSVCGRVEKEIFLFRVLFLTAGSLTTTNCYYTTMTSKHKKLCGL